MSSNWLCPLCQSFAVRGLKGVLRHVGAVHAHEANFHIVCGVGGCPCTYRNFHSYKKHLYKKHREVLKVAESRSSAFVSENSVDLEEHNLCFDFHEEEDDTVSEAQLQSREKKVSALFLLKTSTLSKVSNTALDNLICDVSLLLEKKITVLKKDLDNLLHERGLDLGHEYSNVFERNMLTAPFSGLTNEYLRRIYYKEEMSFLVGHSVSCILH